ncbi:MAG: SH3 domain-containing protein, partial [Chitinivibrionales bacterium]
GSEDKGDSFTGSETPDHQEGPERVILVKDNVNFRSEPDLSDDSNIIRRLVIGTEAVRTQREEKWSRIKTDKGSTGWVYSSMVEPEESLSSEEYSELREHRDRIGSEDEETEVSNKSIDSTSKIPVPEETAMPGFDMTAEDEGPAEQDREDLPGAAKKKESEESAGEPPDERMVPYRTFGRDPFIPLEDSVLIEKGLPDVNNFDLVGLVYNEGGENLAVLQHMSEESENYVLKENDKVAKGRVLKIKEDRVVFLITDMGMSRTYTIEIQEDKE